MSAAGAGLLALLDTLTFPEVLAILVIALVVLGPEKLPGAARSVGEWTAKLRALTANLESEVREVLDDPSMQPIRELGEFAAQPRRKLAEYARAAAIDDDGDRRPTPEPETSPGAPAAEDSAPAAEPETPSDTGPSDAAGSDTAGSDAAAPSADPAEPPALGAPPVPDAPWGPEVPSGPEAHRDGAETGPDAQ